jgi:hypothetical protein
MTEFFECFEHQLIAAGHRLGPARQPRRRLGRRSVLALVFALMLAGAAIAATQPWIPKSLQHSKYPAPPISAGRPLASEVRLLGVLRRPAAPADRSRAVDRVAGFSGSPRSTTGVYTNYIRRIGTTTSGAPIVLVPLRTWRPAPEISKPNALCVIYPDPAAPSSAGKGCWTQPEVQAGHAYASLGTHVFGLVPDRVTHVLVLYATGPSVSAEVHDNFYDAPGQLDRTTRTPTARAPQTIEMLDANENPVTP